MFKYLVKNLKSLLTKQGVISLLLVINIVVSAFVICFSYGLYQNYDVTIEKGEQEDIFELDLHVNHEYEEKSEYGVWHPHHEITKSKIMEFVFALSEKTADNIDYFSTSSLFKNDVFCFAGEDYGLYRGDFLFRRVNEKIYPSGHLNTPFWDKEGYANGDKIVLIGEELYNENGAWGFSYGSVGLSSEGLEKGTTHVMINDEAYRIASTYPGCELYVPYTCIPDDTRPIITIPENCLDMHFIEPVTRSQYNEIKSLVQEIMGDYVYVPEIEFVDAKEIYYYKTIILISVVIAILAAINMAILYRYILEKRSSELAILRICGCSKAKAVMSYLIECMIINAPLFALSQLLYHKHIMPKLTGLFPHMEGAYSFKLYAAIFGIYVVASLAVMLVMIVFTVRKHSLVEQKNSSKAKTRFGIMKIFEVLQLTVVIAIILCVVSAIASRYDYYKPFEQYLEREGYMLRSSNAIMYKEKFDNVIGDNEVIVNMSTSVQDGDITLTGTAYSDEFVDAYKPPMKEGVWLGETTDTYENSGYIPTVITYCNGRYKVGDVIENEVALEYDENGNPQNTIVVKHKIIGILMENANIASCCIPHEGVPRDFRDIYDTYNYDFEQNDYILVRAKDEYDCYGTYSVVFGTQFVFADNMTKQEYKELGMMLDGMDSVSFAPLSEVNENSLNYIYEQMYTLFPIALCIFILTVISAVSINAIYTKRQLRNYAIFYICGARWKTCALKSLKDSAITCAVASALCALILFIGKQSFLKETVISFGIWHAVVCLGVIALYLILSMIMPIAIIGSSQPKDVLKEE